MCLVITVRKLSEPMHHSVSSNNLSGIIIPSRYSSNNLAAMNTGDLGLGRSASCVNLDSLYQQENNLHRTASAAWVARGVELCMSLRSDETCSNSRLTTRTFTCPCTFKL